MNGKWMPFLLAVALVVGLPRLLYGVLLISNLTDDTNEGTSTSTQKEDTMSIRVLTEDGFIDMELEEYLVGVLLMEIPADFHMEAEKAQAVVARTYALRSTKYKDKHPENAICTNPGCCQGYRDVGEYLLSGGREDRIKRARDAVAGTQGLVLTYEGVLIDATYFSCSGGQTEDALAVWGVDVPYLQSVTSPGEEIATYYWDSVQFSTDEFMNALGRELSGAPDRWFGLTTYTNGGGVETMVIGGKVYTGTQLRAMLNLRSTAFTVSVDKDTISIVTRGFGHRVGMSQYGAQAMALNGAGYEQILIHYYPGTEIDKAEYIS